MNQAAKKHLLQLIGAMILYALILFVSVRLLEALNGSPWRFMAAILPMLPIVLGLLAFLGLFNTIDEMLKRIHLAALAFAFGATGLLTFAYGLLQNAGLPQVSFIAVFPSMIALWGVGYIFASWRYQ